MVLFVPQPVGHVVYLAGQAPRLPKLDTLRLLAVVRVDVGAAAVPQGGRVRQLKIARSST